MQLRLLALCSQPRTATWPSLPLLPALPACPQDKDDVIDVVMASAHVPWLLDWRLATRCRSMAACVDGSLLYMLTRWGGWHRLGWVRGMRRQLGRLIGAPLLSQHARLPRAALST